MRTAWIALSAVALWGCAPKAEVAAPAPAPAAKDEARLRQVGAGVLFWSAEERLKNFPAMEKIFPGHVVKAGGKVKPLPEGAPLPLDQAEVDAFMAAQNVAGLLVLQDGKIRLERYALGYSREGRWTSFSVAKSFTSTLVGYTAAFPGVAAYAASKSGLIGLTQALAAEYGPQGVRVNAILPGAVDTAMYRDMNDTSEAQSFITNLHALKRVARPEELARSVLYLASDDASFVTGTASLVDGGVSITRT